MESPVWARLGEVVSSPAVPSEAGGTWHGHAMVPLG